MRESWSSPDWSLSPGGGTSPRTVGVTLRAITLNPDIAEILEVITETPFT